MSDERSYLEELWSSSRFEVLSAAGNPRGCTVREIPCLDGKRCSGQAWLFDFAVGTARQGYYDLAKGYITEVQSPRFFEELGEAARFKLDLARKALCAHHKLIDEAPR